MKNKTCLLLHYTHQDSHGKLHDAIIQILTAYEGNSRKYFPKVIFRLYPISQDHITEQPIFVLYTPVLFCFFEWEMVKH